MCVLIFYSELVQRLCLGLVIKVLGCVQNHPFLLCYTNIRRIKAEKTDPG